MSISMYKTSVPEFVRALGNLSAILAKGEAHAQARGFDPAVLLAARLFPDMFPLTRQVQIACDTAKGAAARLAGVEVPKHADTEQSFAELQARIEKVVAFVQSVPAAAIDAAADREIVLAVGKQELRFTGLQYLMEFVWPNIHFHITTAYGILRHNGVELGKRDYLGNS